MNEQWEAAQKWETEWWGNCVNTFAEETKQITYAHRMGLEIVGPAGQWPLYDMQGRSVVDLGGGPASILLKCVNVRGTVVDPASFPHWTIERYLAAGIDFVRSPAEEFAVGSYDECWIYNVLQHVVDPEKIVANARAIARVVRLFEWIDLPPYQGHLHELKADGLGLWLEGPGKIEEMNENGCQGRAFYGVWDGAPRTSASREKMTAERS